MDMKDLAKMLEGEFSEAVEVKNPKSLHRCVALIIAAFNLTLILN